MRLTVMESAMIGGNITILAAMLTLALQQAADLGVTLFIMGLIGVLAGALTAIAKGVER